jgi:methylated-DNA-[protein]-cysteine S-methyltransferase
MKYYLRHQSPLGELLLAATERGLSGIYFDQHRHFKGMDGWRAAEDHPLLQQTALQLDQYFAGRRTRFDMPLDLEGTEFQLLVWRELLTIPYGQTIRYAEHAQRIGKPAAMRAVGAAIGRNPVSIVIPCHRVVGASGALTGYAGGLERKSALLALERITL